VESLEGEPEWGEAERKKRLAALRPLAPPINRPSSPLLPPAGAPVIPRDVNRWFLETPPHVEPPAKIHSRAPSPVRTFLAVFVGASAGAFGAMVFFYDRLLQILDAWMH
jgi:hypothetical protein